MLVAEWAREWPRFRRELSPDSISRTLNGCKPFIRDYGTQHLEDVNVAVWALSHPKHMRWVRTFLRDAVAAGVATRCATDDVRIRERQPREHHLPSEEEVHAVAEKMLDLRKMTLFAAFTGLRASEIVNLHSSDVDWDTGRVFVRQGKGGKDRTVLCFRPELLEAGNRNGQVWRRRLDVYLPGRSFPVQRWSPLTWDSLNGRWVKARRQAGLPENFRFHDLRRFCATWLLDHGVSDLDVAVQLGHFDKRGVPNADLVRRVYGRPDVDRALERLEAARAQLVA